ncbi:nucleoporin p58/p45-like isoform X2 [Mercenaria mercenaria]|uniref:nucleoporin p58/p45-like isoform X2 n=1 Tax=Mercenaria mercenaria TaxID=6596 RepID=UPI00234F8F52|nr:nucleoporin p58/p45-like isoform X2 [Mercenaria mercenaria]
MSTGFGGGFNFTKPATTAATTAASGGFAFVTSTPAAGAAPTGGFNFGTPAAVTKTTTSSTAHSTPFGTPATTTSSGLTLGQPASTVTGFSLGGMSATTSASSGLFGTATGSTSSSAAPSFGFSKPLSGTQATTTSSSLGLSGGLKLGTATTSSALSGGLKLGTTASSTLGGGLKLGTTASSMLGGGVGGFGLTTGGASTLAGGSIFGQNVAKTTSSGLGGVDPKTTTSTATSNSGKPGENKTVKETPVENNILLDVDELRKFVKDEKSEMEQMKRMSSTPMVKVQEDNAALKQLLSVVSSGLQKNACAVDKLKKEMTQELKNAEMAIRTKETPPGLQYENTAPTLYFQNVIENFETQMLTYRQQIEMLENHLSSLHQPNRLTPEELILLLRKLHEAFVAMAAQLQHIHEAVKTQKDHYLNYRKVFHGDNRNIFERQKKAPVKVETKSHTDMYGQPPFPGVNNAAAVAMATALTRTQQPQPTSGAPPVTGFSNFQPSAGFGASTTGFGAFGSATQASTFKGFGTGTNTFGTGTSLFGNTSNLATTQAGSLFSSTVPGATPQLNLSTATEQPFQLNKPPVGSKRGKR